MSGSKTKSNRLSQAALILLPGNSGTVKVLNLYKEGEFAELECRTLSFTFIKDDKITTQAQRSFCKNEHGEWTFDD
jgi:surface antigen